MSETILLIDGVPNSVGGRRSVTSEAFGVFNQIDVVALGGGIQKAKIGIPVVAPRQLVNLIPVQSQIR